MANKSFSDLPEEMTTEILIRLPVKSLGQCKSVCKPWLYTISNPRFVKSHLHRAITTSRNDPILLNIINVDQLALLASWGPLVYYVEPTPTDLQQQQLQRRRRQLVNQALQDAIAQDLSRLSLQFDRVVIPRPFATTHFVSCCNGIICLSSYFKAVYLWNPSINKFRKLFLDYANVRERYRYRPVTIGFGYDNVSNEYKLLRFVYDQEGGVVPVTKVYYINADCCREIQGPILKTQIRSCRSNIAVNGVLYFDGVDQIVSFDLHDEVFGLVPFPDSIQRKMSDVMDFEGSVAMAFESGPGVDLWTLDNVSGKLSWTKKFSIKYGFDDLDTGIWLSCYLGEEYVNVYATAEESEIPVGAMLEDAPVPVHAALKYTQTLVSLDGFEPVE
ncbi:hypothetical protein POM88_008863 [Heracleum sosnowskyi]|uniref:F-box domain-containing protein n=1 Tax=Heracleum sosnowskyi TaxID=360622 RepID=A0AAD8N229_9APIA|nr:hypothetical protein POM88_008863 [Heracleum sosnowskyi]